MRGQAVDLGLVSTWQCSTRNHDDAAEADAAGAPPVNMLTDGVGSNAWQSRHGHRPRASHPVPPRALPARVPTANARTCSPARRPAPPGLLYAAQPPIRSRRPAYRRALLVPCTRGADSLSSGSNARTCSPGYRRALSGAQEGSSCALAPARVRRPTTARPWHACRKRGVCVVGVVLRT